MDNNNVDIVFSTVLVEYEGLITRIVRPSYQEDMPSYIIKGGEILGTGSNIFVRRCVYDDICGFNETYGRHQDLEFMLRALENHSYGIVDNIGIVKVDKKNIKTGKLKLEQTMEITEKYFSDFNHILNRLTEDERKKTYASEAIYILSQSLAYGTWEDVLKAKRYLLRYRRLTVGEQIKILLKRFKIGKNDLYIVMQRNMIRKDENKDLMSKLPKETIDEISLLMNQGN
jgi:hypothetical protein